MTFAESWVVTILGTGVVFTGLVLTYLTIVLIVKIPSLMANWKKPEPTVVLAPQAAAPVVATASMDPEKMAVIAMVLEVELRLRKNVANTRYTFRKP